MNEIRKTDIQLLTQNLGAEEMVRFLQQSDLGWGDYTKERRQWLGNPSLNEIATEIKTMRKIGTNIGYQTVSIQGAQTHVDDPTTH